LVKQDGRQRGVDAHSVEDRRPPHAADRAGGSGQRKRSSERADYVHHDHDPERRDGVGVEGKEGAPGYERVESKVSRHAAHDHPGAAMKEEPARVLDGGRERSDRSCDLWMRGLQPLGMGGGAADEQH
jgi:hypothetical protein